MPNEIKPFRWNYNKPVWLKKFAALIWLSVAVILSTPSAYADKSFSVTGYKNLKLGASKNEIESQGFECGDMHPSGNTRTCDLNYYYEPYPTIGGMDVSAIWLDLRNDRLEEITLIVMANSRQTRRVFEYNFGKPHVAPVINSPEDDRLYWIGKEGNSYSFNYYPDGGPSITPLKILNKERHSDHLPRDDF